MEGLLHEYASDADDQDDIENDSRGPEAGHDDKVKVAEVIEHVEVSSQGHLAGPAEEGKPARLPGADVLLAGFKSSGVSLTSAEDSAHRPAAGQHQGRVRCFPHVEGNYPTHVYINVAPPEHAKQQLERMLQAIARGMPDLQPVRASSVLASKDLALLQPRYHLSLSRTVPVRYHQIQPLVTELRACLAKTSSFTMSTGGLEVFENDDHTRSFLALAVASGREQVCRAIRRVDRAFAAHGLALFHREPRPHVSLLWALGAQSAQLQAALQGGLAEELHAPAWEMQVERIECRIGEREYAVWEGPT